MQSAILGKVTPYLSRPPKSESEVVYVLVETRKFLDRTGQDFGRLRFYCDWALHPKMSKHVANKVLHEIDEAVLARDEGRPVKSGSVEGLFTALFGLQEFQKRLDEFCGRNKLPKVWTGTDEGWSQVVQQYGAILQDCPVEVAGKKKSQTKCIRKVVISACWREEGHNQAFLQVNWELEFLDKARKNETIMSFFGPQPSVFYFS